jgi:hypothetical protein
LAKGGTGSWRTFFIACGRLDKLQFTCGEEIGAASASGGGLKPELGTRSGVTPIGGPLWEWAPFVSCCGCHGWAMLLGWWPMMASTCVGREQATLGHCVATVARLATALSGWLLRAGWAA